VAETHTLKTHIAYIIDASSSMQEFKNDVIKVVDNQTAFLASLPDKDHEVRISVYVFSDAHSVKCLISDTDVLRMPSIAGMYEPEGWTALLDATGLAIEDLKELPTKYGDHSFLLFVFTDGRENRSRRYSGHSMAQLLGSLGPEWTPAGLVPNVNGKILMGRYGFANGNITIWNPNSSTGVEEAGEQMKTAIGTYMVSRASGQVGTRTLFSTAPDAVNAKAIQDAGLQPLKPGTYDLIPVGRLKEGQGVLNRDKVRVWEIVDFLKLNGLPFVLGRNYYLLRKKERIQGDKQLAILERATNKVFVGPEVRAMIGLSDKTQSVAADHNKDYAIFVQSKSNNRHLFNGDQILVLK